MPEFVEILEAELSELPFDSFLVDKKALKAYMPLAAFNLEIVKLKLSRYKDIIVELSTQIIPHQNWNAIWESNYEPVKIGGSIFIGASFHSPAKDFKHIITIDPCMSFGTGHHPTTALIMEQMLELDLSEKSFLDFGCGSAILCVLAYKLGAQGIGVEIDPISAEAARKNLETNDVDGFEIRTGNLDSVNEKFDVIVANINKNTIQENAGQLSAVLSSVGQIICSGFLKCDSQSVCASLERQGFKVIKEKVLNEWIMVCAKK